ncbi:MAG TPA: PilZ domain-containing protein [Methylococcaceae bacterium]|nr:PilZ domain-containing protein [Methylococcaceae bacterium]
MTALPTQLGEKRRFHRVLYRTPAVLVSGEKRWTCTVLDLSLKGCLLELPEPWEGDPQASHRVEIHLEGGPYVEMGVTLAHFHGRQVGLLCRDIDLDSICTLRRIVELNLGDSSLLERDFHSLVHPHA